jgi:lipoprotein-anchoring transpeptidase ErfK/SrfK
VHGFLHRATALRRIAAGAVGLIAAGMVMAGLFGAAQPAAAQQGFGNFFGYQTQPRPKRRSARRSRQPSDEQQTTEKSADKKADKKKDAKEAKEAAPSGPVYLVISLGDQHVSVYDSTGRIARSRISTGMPGHPTPIGVFSVIGKERWHHSNIYSGAPMPWMQRITWSGVAMHAGVVPGYPASHGCIRLPYSFAPQLWGMTKMGARVVVSRRDTIPFEISHASLPLPKMQPAPATLPGTQQASQAADAPVELASMGTPAHVPMTTSAVSGEAGANATVPAKTLDPMAYAAALKQHATARKAVADRAAKDALDAAQAAGAEARQAVDDLRKAEADVKAAEARIAELDTQSDPTKGNEGSDAASAEAAATARTAAQSELVRARAALDEARAREAVKTPAAFAAVQVWKEAVAAREAAEETLREADRRSEPVSVLISKKEGRVFIRQDWKEVYEAPVSIRDPDRPLGTHVFIAVEAKPDGSAVRWSAISVPSQPASEEGSRRRSKNRSEEPTSQQAATPETAAGALDRIELPPEARERIAELLWTGASLIVSDHARSDEMDQDTDFIVLTR